MYALQNAHAVTTNASELIKKAKAFVDREIILIPNGVDTEHFKLTEKNLALAESLGIVRHVILSEAKNLYHDERDSSVALKGLPQSDMMPVIGFVGELREKKGLKTLLQAHTLANKKQPITLLIVGEVRQGEDKKYFDEFRSANPQLPITVTGYMPSKDLPAYYALMDILVHPSLRDGLPNAVLEAMACEKAIVATGVGGVPEAIKDGETGAIVPAKDAEALSQTILHLLEDPSLRSRLGKAARQKIIQDFTLEKELDGNLGVYRKLGLNP
jgi:glycosyltransferase involved in cell wall biosynthesis